VKLAITHEEQILRVMGAIKRYEDSAATIVDRINRLDNPKPRVVAAIERKHARMIERVNGAKAELYYLTER